MQNFNFGTNIKETEGDEAGREVKFKRQTEEQFLVETGQLLLLYLVCVSNQNKLLSQRLFNLVLSEPTHCLTFNQV